MSQNPNPSLLDPGQCVKRAFDGDNDRFRVDAEVTATIGTVEVSINATDDSIKVGNSSTGPFLLINPDGSINANVTITGFSAATPTIANVSATVANIEYFYRIPDNTKKLVMRARGMSTIQFAYSSGNSGTLYLTLPQSCSYAEDNLLLVGKTLYFQANKPNEVLEFISWV